jgi:D-glycero-alpha-D-manno-heptose-7-phosphate kinase
MDRFGELLHEGWEQKKRTAQGITTPYIDELYDAARKAGAIGGKIAGAGGGGYLLLYVPFQKKHFVRDRLTEMGGQVLNFRFDQSPMHTWRVYH